MKTDLDFKNFSHFGPVVFRQGALMNVMHPTRSAIALPQKAIPSTSYR